MRQDGLTMTELLIGTGLLVGVVGMVLAQTRYAMIHADYLSQA